MHETDSFTDLIRRVRNGDQEAAEIFVKLYEPAIRRAARIRSLDPRLAPLLDSMDIVQSVFGSFFVRAALGQYELQKPEQALRLLINMSRHKLTDYVRKQGAERRDFRRQSADQSIDRNLPAPGLDPGQQAATHELAREFRRRLTPAERELAEWRALGKNWGEIAAARGESPEALRKQLGRAIQRISQDLGLDKEIDV